GALSRAATGAARGARRLRHPRLGEELPDRALAVAERALLRALRDCDPELRLAITDGAGPVRRLDLRSWALPRRNPTGAACARAVAADPRWAYPALYALLEDRALPGPAARAAWRGGGRPAAPGRRHGRRGGRVAARRRRSGASRCGKTAGEGHLIAA